METGSGSEFSVPKKAWSRAMKWSSHGTAGPSWFW